MPMNVKEEEAAIRRFFQNLNITTTMIDLLKDNNLIKLQTELRKKCLTTIAVYNRLIPYATKTIRTIEKIIYGNNYGIRLRLASLNNLFTNTLLVFRV